MIEVDEMDVLIESIYEELIEEGYSEDDVEEAIEFALTEELSEASDKYYDSAVKASKKADAKIKRAEMVKKAKGRLRFLGRKVKEKVGSVKKKAGIASAQAQVAAYNKARETAQTAGDKARRAKKNVEDAPKKAKKGVKGLLKRAAQKVVDRMSEEKEPEGEMINEKPGDGYLGLSEEASDAMKDRRMERGGVDGNNRYKSATKNVAKSGGKKRPYDGMSALEKVKASIRAKHGQGAIMDTKKK